MLALHPPAEGAAGDAASTAQAAALEERPARASLPPPPVQPAAPAFEGLGSQLALGRDTDAAPGPTADTAGPQTDGPSSRAAVDVPPEGDRVEPVAEVTPQAPSLELLLASPITLVEPTEQQLRDLQTQRANDVSKYLPRLHFDLLDPCVENRTIGAAVDAGEKPDARAYVDGQCRGF